MQNNLIYELKDESKKTVEVVEIVTNIGIFLCGTWDNKCVLFEFKDRKPIKQILLTKSKHFEFVTTLEKNPIHLEIEKQIQLYFEGQLTEFSIPLILTGTEFQKKVWRKLLEIPYGETISYGELARRIGNPKAMRAVGAANGANSLAIIIPCHRVIRADGHLQGYGGGLWRKKRLLTLEKDTINESSQGNLLEWVEH